MGLISTEQYQQCDVEDDEESFAGGTGEISPVEFEPSVSKMLKERQPVLFWIWSRSRGTGTEHHGDRNQNRQRKPHCSDVFDYYLQSRVPDEPPGSITQRRNLTLWHQLDFKIKHSQKEEENRAASLLRN